MSRLVARAESWERIYEAYNNVNFAAFDYNTIKQSLLDYIKLYFPETFNDFIESSEFIAIIESFAYVAELLAYRFDLDAHENFLSAAQRKDSILKLAKLISYTADRPLPARGLVKITSISTTESIIDSNGINLAHQTIRWNDVNNSRWKDQFILIMNRVLEQNFGTVRASDRFQIDNVLFELYNLTTIPLSTGIVSYSANVNNQSIPMELVPIEYNPTEGIIERRPSKNANFSLVYAQDGLGDISDTTGFFCYTKQGKLQKFRGTFDGITPNQYYEIPLDNTNETDIWVNNVDPASGVTLDLPSLLPYRRLSIEGKSGEWVPVDVAHAQNVIFNTNPRRSKYEIETRNNNRARIIFGDGEFADIPSGTFDFWARSSIDEDIVVSQSAITNSSGTFTYVDSYNRTQTFSFTFSLINSLTNNTASETLEHIRTTAPAIYYSQDRMVNGQDYNSFMLQDSSILKLRSLNRTFAGDSKYIPWHDPSTSYENVKIFGNDGALYYKLKIESVMSKVVSSVNTLITSYIEPLLSSTDMFLYISSFGITANQFRRTFNADEKSRLLFGLTPPPTPSNIELYYNINNCEWYVVQMSSDPDSMLSSVGWPESFIPSPLISVLQQQTEKKYQVNRLTNRLIFQSSSTTFWNNNLGTTVIDYNTLSSVLDKIVILKANPNYNRNTILQNDWKFNILGAEIIDSGVGMGLTDDNCLSVMPVDENGDGVPDNLDINDMTNPQGLADIIKPKILVDLTSTAILPANGIIITLPIYYIVGAKDVYVENANGIDIIQDEDWFEDNTPTGISNTITLTSGKFGSSIIRITVQDYIYFARKTTLSGWIIAPTTPESLFNYKLELLTPLGLWKREIGRSELNFAWFHYTPRYHLIDPAASNIIDTFIIQKGYFTEVKRWLEDPLVTQPIPPTALDLRLAYNNFLDNKMISDTIVLHPGKIKLLFGSKAILPLQATLKVIRSADNTLTDNQIKTTIVTTVRNFFDMTMWEFGESFYFTEMATAIHAALPVEISTVVLVPVYVNNHFGDLFQVEAKEDEIFYPDITANDVEIVTDINATVLRMGQQDICPSLDINIHTKTVYEYAFNFEQPVASATWSINHELGFYPIVRVYNTNLNEIQPTSIVHLSTLLTIISFKSPTAGTARLV